MVAADEDGVGEQGLALDLDGKLVQAVVEAEGIVDADPPSPGLTADPGVVDDAAAIVHPAIDGPVGGPGHPVGHALVFPESADVGDAAGKSRPDLRGLIVGGDTVGEDEAPKEGVAGVEAS